MTRWTLRDATPADHDGLVFLWLESFARSKFSQRAAIETMREHKARIWTELHGVVRWLLERERVLVLCDPQNAGIIWAFACSGAGRLHYVMVKDRFVDWREEMLLALLGAMPLDGVAYSFQSADYIEVFGAMPSGWRFDPHLPARLILEAAA
ncbi:hypothetical protein [Pendulispora albinea]|uniref:Uncharacterized protein n=1 Tax=Pendulispora albinea TaxID=2741071 RepID=A0ABZ2LYK7_9BACT